MYLNSPTGLWNISSLRIIAVPRTNSANDDDLDLLAQRQGHDVIAHMAIAGLGLRFFFYRPWRCIASRA